MDWCIYASREAKFMGEVVSFKDLGCLFLGFLILFIGTSMNIPRASSPSYSFQHFCV